MYIWKHNGEFKYAWRWPRLGPSIGWSWSGTRAFYTLSVELWRITLWINWRRYL